MLLGLPSRSSPLFVDAMRIANNLLPDIELAIDSLPKRQLFFQEAFGCFTGLVFARASDLPLLVEQRAVGVAITGSDALLEHILSSPSSNLRCVEIERFADGSRVCFIGKRGRRVRRLYTEYPNIASAISKDLHRPDLELVALRGSAEGVVAADRYSLGLAVVASGTTTRSNGLSSGQTLLANWFVAISSREDKVLSQLIPDLPEVEVTIDLEKAQGDLSRFLTTSMGL